MRDRANEANKTQSSEIGSKQPSVKREAAAAREAVRGLVGLKTGQSEDGQHIAAPAAATGEDQAAAEEEGDAEQNKAKRMSSKQLLHCLTE